MRIGIFGGTFDPPHLGHLILASEALDQLKLDKIVWLVTADPPHKQDQFISPVTDRISLVRAALRGNPSFEISRVEIDRPGPHYALDTVKILKKQFAGAELIYLIGADSLRDLPTWHKPEELIDQVDGLGVMRRHDVDFDLPALTEHFPNLTNKLAFIDTPLVEISSSQIRGRAAQRRPYRYFVPNAVYEIIESRQLYQNLIAEDGGSGAGS